MINLNDRYQALTDEEKLFVDKLSEEDLINFLLNGGEVKSPNSGTVTQRNLKMVFVKSDDTTWTLTIPDYKLDYEDPEYEGNPEEEIHDAMEGIMEQNVFTPDGLSIAAGKTFTLEKIERTQYVYAD